jgi:hypothetical protein
MTKTYVIDKFEQIIEIGTTLGCNWYRGHSIVVGELTPCIFRKEYSNDIYLAFNPNPEFKIATDFKRKAPSIATKLPKENNHLEWLFLMQHHGVPTRLLDWTENILAATFFAVTDNQSQDGELWTMLPWKLNESHGFYGLPLLGKSKVVKFLSHEIFHNNPAKLAEKYKLANIPKVPLALQPQLKHPRYAAQQSCFTIHPKPTEGYTIPDIITDETFLIRYIIPKELKREFETKLSYLGITNYTLFPDLEGLAKTIVRQEKSMGWGQPRPLRYRELNDK